MGWPGGNKNREVSTFVQRAISRLRNAYWMSNKTDGWEERMPILKAKLLIVDDEPSTRTLLGQIFRGMGHPVRVAEDGFAALDEMRTETPDILVSDLNMPRMSGFELLSVVRRKIPEVYVIATSGAFSGDEVPNGIAADAFHEKATGLSGLFEMVKSAVIGANVRAASAASTPIWISHFRKDNSMTTRVLLSCAECLRSFSLSVGAADFVIRETECVHCGTMIHYATVQPLNSALPHRFEPESSEAASFGSHEVVA
jgi:CheY-like chemotaxis protein